MYKRQGQLGSPQTPWFESLAKPDIFPPPAVFGVVWGILYVMIGASLALVVSSWGAYGRGAAIIGFALHFIGNLAWTPVFFGMQEMQIALYILAYVAVSLMVVIWLFWRVRKLAAIMLVPYLAWACFATVLNYQFIQANPDGGTDTGDGAIERIEL